MNDLHPRVDYGVSDTFTLSLPQRPWTRIMGGVGGSAMSATGIRVGYRIRTDSIAEMRWRFYESEVPTISDWLEWAFSGDSFQVYPDASDPTTSYTVILDSPNASDEDIRFEREQQGDMDMLSLTVRLRVADPSLRFDSVFFENP